MTKRLSQRFAVQLIGLLVMGILAGNVIGVLILVQRTPLALRAASRAQVVDRIVSAVRIAEVAPRESVNEVLKAMSLSSERFWFADQPAVSGEMDAAEAALASDLRARLGPRPHDVRIRFVAASAGAPAHPAGEDFSLGFLVSIGLQSGQWLNTERSGLENRKWWRGLPFSITASMIPVLLIGSFFAWRIARPVQRLADAAERMGRGEPVPPLPLEGPRELQETTLAFNAMQGRISRFVQDRMQLLAAVSHDLRTPITALKLRAELVDDAGLRSAMTRTLDEMAEMVEATLGFAREESQQEPTRMLELVALIEAIADERQSLGHAVSAHSTVTRLPYRCRPASLRRALNNLVDNAVRYAGNARIGLETSGSSVLVSVEDDGPGVPEAMLETLFEPFTRLETSRSSETGGVGLGLAIVRSCVHAHGGEVRLHNRPEGGLRAVVRLPA
ncbi:MAG TPA: ATP-binding protein [Rubrivivax sp.]|nr:ATP-binding protein [Rubrivivax sp.]